MGWQMKLAPTHCYLAIVQPIAAQDRMFEQDEQIMGNHADTK